jgi:hypothetical protein
MENDQPENKSFVDKLFSSDSVLIALAPLFAYLISYGYQIGYLLEFHIPLRLANFGLPELLDNFDEAIVRFVVILILFLFIYWIIALRTGKKQINISLLPAFLSIIYVIFILGCVYYWYKNLFKAYTDKVFYTDLIIGLLFVLIFIVVNPFFNRKIRKNEEAQKIYANIFINKTFIVFSIFVMFYLTFFELGHIAAHSQERFYVANTNPECVVVYLRSDGCKNRGMTHS